MEAALPVFLFVAAGFGIAAGMILLGKLIGPKRRTPVKDMPYESGVDPLHDTARRFDIRFHLVAISFLIFDVELLFLYPWAVASQNEQGIKQVVADGAAGGLTRELVFFGAMIFIAMLVAGLIYDWRKGVFRWQR